MSKNETPSFKMVVIGDAQIGKSSLLFRFVHHRFPKINNTTLGASFYCKHDSNHGVNINMWDTAGQERFRSILPIYLKNVNLVLFVYDITSRESFNHLKEYWIDFVKSKHTIVESRNLHRNVPDTVGSDDDSFNPSNPSNPSFQDEDEDNFYQAILVGNKSDLKDHRSNSRKEGKAFAKQLGISFIETSALDGTNIPELWSMIQSKLIKFEVVPPDKKSIIRLSVDTLKSIGETVSEQGCRCVLF